VVKVLASGASLFGGAGSSPSDVIDHVLTLERSVKACHQKRLLIHQSLWGLTPLPEPGLDQVPVTSRQGVLEASPDSTREDQSQAPLDPFSTRA
jgi:hypothetical protein